MRIVSIFLGQQEIDVAYYVDKTVYIRISQINVDVSKTTDSNE
ncbi:MAG: hypothetical protein ACRCZ9_08290 [Fusobacteriaceae bacterium]